MKKMFSSDNSCLTGKCAQSAWNIFSLVFVIVVLVLFAWGRFIQTGHNVGLQIGFNKGVSVGTEQAYREIAANVVAKKCAEPGSIFVDKKNFLIFDNDCLPKETSETSIQDSAEAEQ